MKSTSGVLFLAVVVLTTSIDAGLVSDLNPRALTGDIFGGVVNTKGTYSEQNMRPRGFLGDVMGGFFNTKGTYNEESYSPRALTGDLFGGVVNTKGTYSEQNMRPRGFLGDLMGGFVNTKGTYIEENRRAPRGLAGQLYSHGSMRPRGFAGDIFGGVFNTKGTYTEKHEVRNRGLYENANDDSVWPYESRTSDHFNQVGVINKVNKIEKTKNKSKKTIYIDELLRSRGADNLANIYSLGGELALQVVELVTEVFSFLTENQGNNKPKDSLTVDAQSLI